jgi:hypothetical protein
MTPFPGYEIQPKRSRASVDATIYAISILGWVSASIVEERKCEQNTRRGVESDPRDSPQGLNPCD